MSPTPRPRKRRTTSKRIPASISKSVAAAEAKQAQDIVVLDLRPAKAFTDFFIICTGNNARQVQAIADEVTETLRKAGMKPALVEGRTNTEWVLIDYFDFIVHVFTPATREFYGLERLWGDAERIDLSA